jgi:protocatechuate 3,4-dioxygenase beta subunit
VTHDEQMLSRRRLVELGLTLPPLAAGGGALLDVAAAAAAPLALTPSCDDGDDPTPELTEGPYYTPNSPRRRSIVPAGARGTRLTITGRVLNRRCRPVPRALLDFWQCDARGIYDNEGYRFRGHQFTDARGRYVLQTIVPALYPGRTRHIHLKVQAPNRDVLTTQLFFPGERGNRSDGIFDARLLLTGWRRIGNRRVARFEFIVEI